MSTPPEPHQGADAPPRREHARPVRFAREVRLPLAVRKELLLTRAALERHDCLQALQQVKGGARRIGSLGSWLPRFLRPASWTRVLGLAHDYPLVSTALTLALPLVKRTPVLRWTWKASKIGLAAGAAYWAYNTWREAKSQAVPPAKAAAAPASGTSTADTGFSDPLVR